MTEQEEWQCSYERRVEAYERGEYDNIRKILEEEYDEDEAIYFALCFLEEKLSIRVKILQRVRDLYRKHNLEILREHEREWFIRQNIKRARIWFTDFRREEHLLNYPYYRLNIPRLKKSQKELKYLEKWQLKYIPEWVNWKKGQEPYITTNHSSGVIIQFLGSDGRYSTYNSSEYETKRIFNPQNQTLWDNLKLSPFNRMAPGTAVTA